ncbi:MAG: hypothetical protein ABI478_05440, partial [Propionivibrio sp.]
MTSQPGPSSLTSTAPPIDRGARVAMIYALVAQRLTAYYEHGQWLSEAQGASLAADWLARGKRQLPLAERRHLSALSDDLARDIAVPLSREAGLYTAHEMILKNAVETGWQAESLIWSG